MHIIITINILLRKVSTCIGHLQVIVDCSEVVVCCVVLNMSAVGDVVCVLCCVVFSASGLLDLCFVTSFV